MAYCSCNSIITNLKNIDISAPVRRQAHRQVKVPAPAKPYKQPVSKKSLQWLLEEPLIRHVRFCEGGGAVALYGHGSIDSTLYIYYFKYFCLLLHVSQGVRIFYLVTRWFVLRIRIFVANLLPSACFYQQMRRPCMLAKAVVKQLY